MWFCDLMGLGIGIADALLIFTAVYVLLIFTAVYRFRVPTGISDGKDGKFGSKDGGKDPGDSMGKKEKEKGKKEKDRAAEELDKNKNERPVWKGSDAGMYRIVDKASLKSHREHVRKV